MPFKWQPHPYRLLMITLLILGVVLRFYNLDHKIYWHDEVFTSLRVAGYQGQEFVSALFNGQLVSVADLQNYQSLRPNSDVSDVVNSLITEDAHHPPLYYALMRGWVEIWGLTPDTTRLFSVVVSLFAFSALYWLCIELFAASFVAEMAIALMAVSPLHLLYAQEARQYGFWVVWILVASAALLRAIRIKTKTAWGIYAIALTLGCYTFLFNLFVAVGHGLYVLGLRKKEIVPPYTLASGLAGVLFLPWMVVVLDNYQRVQAVTSWTQGSFDAIERIQSWCWNLGNLFFDLNYTSPTPLTIVSITLVLILVLYALIYLCDRTPRRAWLMVVGLIGITPLVLCSQDVIQGGLRSVSARYFMISYVGLDIAMAHLLAQKVRANQRQLRWKGITATVLTAGLISCLCISQAQIWWSKNVDVDILLVADVINQAESPLILSSAQETNTGSLLALSYLVDPKVRFQLTTGAKLPSIAEGFSTIYLFNPSDTLTQNLLTTQQGEMKPIPNSRLLEWVVTQK